MIQKLGVGNSESDQEEEPVINIQSEERELVTDFKVPNPELVPVIQVQVVDYECESFLKVLKVDNYTINIISKGNIIKQTRTNKDLEWISNIIRTKYPGIGVPVYCIPTSEFNLAKEKCVVAEMFLRYLCEHQTLRHSPQVKAFFLTKIEYLNLKKKVQEEQFFFQGIGNWNFQTLTSLVEKLNLNKNKLEQQAYSLLPKETVISQRQVADTIVGLDKVLHLMKTNRNTDKSFLLKESELFQNKSPIQDLQSYQRQIKASIIKNQQLSMQEASREYLMIEMVTTVVRQNLACYQGTYQLMVSLQQYINDSAFSTKYATLQACRQYLKLLTNNFNLDIDRWLLYNDSLFNRDEL